MFDTAPREAPLSECQPSGWLALELEYALASPAVVDDDELVEAVVAFDRVAAWALARQARALAELARRRSDGEFAADEVALALRQSRVSAAARLELATQLDEVLPATLAAWEHGRIDAAKARAIVDACRPLSAERAREVESRVLPRAGEQTPGQLRASLARAVIAVDPGGAHERHEHARRERRVELNPEPEGMASLWALLTAPDAVAAHEHLGELARRLGADDPRGMDARRADILTELLTGRRCHCRPEPGPAPKPTVHVTVPITALLGLDDAPGELRGYGPIPAPLARQLAAEGTWQRLLTDPASGVLLDHGRTTYTPPAGLADFVRARDVECRFPTCRQSARHADLDHARAWADGGSTSDRNLYAACRHHHRLKTHARGWQVTQQPGAAVVFTTPTGHCHASRPHDHRPDPPPSGPDPPP